MRFFWILVAILSAWLLGSNALAPKRAPWRPGNFYPNFSLGDLLSVDIALPAAGKDEAWAGNLTHRFGTWTLTRNKETWVMRQEQLDDFFRAIILAPLPDPTAAIDPSRSASEFGLIPPHAQLTLRAKDGEAPMLNVGDPLPGGQGYFVRNGEHGPIQWVPVNFAPLLARRLEILEDSRGLFVDPETITSFQLNTFADKTTIEIHKGEGVGGGPAHWDLLAQSPKLVHRPVLRAQPEKVMGYLLGWRNLQGIRLSSRPLPKKPLFSFQFETTQHPSPFTLEVSAASEKGHYLLARRDTNETFSCLFPPAAVAPKPEDFLDDHLLNFTEASIASFSVTTGKRRIEAQIHEDPDKNHHWIFFQPQALNEDPLAAKTTVELFFKQLEQLRYESCAHTSKIYPVSKDRAHLSLQDEKAGIISDVRVLPSDSSGKCHVLIGDVLYVLSSDPSASWAKLFTVPASTPTPSPTPAKP